MRHSWAEELQQLRSQLKWSQSELAHHVNVAQGTVQAYEAGVRVPNPRLRAQFRELRRTIEAGGVVQVGEENGHVDFAALVTVLMERWGLTLAQFAQAMGVSVRAVRQWRKGDVIPRGAARARLLTSRGLASPEELRAAPPVVCRGFCPSHIEYVGLRAPLVLQARLTRLATLWWRNEHLRWDLTGEVVEFADGAAAVRWLRPAPPVSPPTIPSVLDYPGIDALRAQLRTGRFALSWRGT